MPTRAYHLVDVFTDRPFAGNQLAVVLDADDLSAAQLQTMAAEFRLSETAFPLASAVADYRLRIFTPVAELPFAGHPSIGTAWLLARLKKIPTGAVRQECGAGVLPVQVTEAGAVLDGGPPEHGGQRPAGPVLERLGLPPEAAAGPALVAGCGVPVLYLPVAAAVLAGPAPAQGAVESVCGWLGATGLVLFDWSDAERHSHARVFVPGIGEDPATGAAGAAFGVYLAATGQADPDGVTTYTIDQGAEMGRPSRLDGTVACRDGAVVRTTVGGGVAYIGSGNVLLP